MILDVIPNNGYLVKWAEQGVLMLNTVLTVRAHMANSHHGKGWEEFTDAAIRALNAQDRPIVFILWGRPAQMKKSMLNNPNHLILEAPHPSPLSAYRGFFGSRPFSKTNNFLKEHGVDLSTTDRKRVKLRVSEIHYKIHELPSMRYTCLDVRSPDESTKKVMSSSSRWGRLQSSIHVD